MDWRRSGQRKTRACCRWIPVPLLRRRLGLSVDQIRLLLYSAFGTRQEFATLAERFTNVEMRLDDLDAKLDQVLAAITTLKNGRDAKPEPARAQKQRKRG